MHTNKKTKWEPAALMVLVLALGLWVAFGPGRGQRFPLTPGSVRSGVMIGDTKGTLEAIAVAEPLAGSVTWTYRLWLPEPGGPRELTQQQAEFFLGAKIVRSCAEGRNPVFRFFNITSWANLAWIGIGFCGQFIFSGRMLLQWIVSERKRDSVINESFWWFSLIGGVTLFAYFVWRQDPVPMLGQAAGIVVYARNIRLLRKQGRRRARKERSCGSSPVNPARAA